MAKDFIVAMLIFSGVLALLVVMIGSFANDYDNPNVIDPEFSAKFDKFDNDTARIGSMWSALNAKDGLSLIGTAEVLFSSTLQVISLIFSSVTAAGKQIAGFGEYFGIPTAISQIFLVLIFATLTVYIVFIILNSTKSGTQI